MADVLTNHSTLPQLAQRLRDRQVELAQTWLERLQRVVPVDRLEVIPAHQLAAPIAALIAEIAAYVELPDSGDPADHVVALNSATALGELRHVQHASVHQLLREYQTLAKLLDEFVETEVARISGADPGAVVTAMRRVSHAVRVLQQETLDTFVANYTYMIERQTTQLRTFSRLVSHEIRQPLAVLQVLARALPTPANDDESVRMMDIFDRSVARLTEVTGKLERLSRVSPTTDLAFSERTIHLTQIAEAAVAQLTDAAAAQGVEIHIHPNLPVVRMDPARAELVFVNLIANGVKFSDPDKATRHIDLYPGAGTDPTVFVRDNGVGMTGARLQTIFREFVRAHAQRGDDIETSGSRLGLGLSIVRECMDHANGSVRVASIEGKGTTFKLTWARPKAP
jgi:signal transduction histidine kinase